jgi:tRNA A37 threonylcarbamoyltransferase TsaD
VPELKYCTDNAAMVAAAAHLYFSRGIESKFSQVTSSNSFAESLVSGQK